MLREGQSRGLGLGVGRSIGMGMLRGGVATERGLSCTILRCEPTEFTFMRYSKFVNKPTRFYLCAQEICGNEAEEMLDDSEIQCC